MASKHRKDVSMPRREFLKGSVASVGAIGAVGGAGCHAISQPSPRIAIDASSSVDDGSPTVTSKAKKPYNGVYAGDRLSRVAFPMGGMGAGMICLEGTGALSHFSLRHKPDIFNEPCVFAAICVKDKPNIARVLEGPVPTWKLFGLPGSGNGSKHKNYGLPRFRQAFFKARFPFGTATIRDDEVPLAVDITGWSPFEPNNPDIASLPVAGIEYRFTNTTQRSLEAVFSFNARNFMSVDQGRHGTRTTPGGFILWEKGPQDKPWEAGAFAATVDDPNAKVNCAWFRGGWFDPLTMAWKDVQEGNCYDRAAFTESGASPGSTVFVPFKLEPNGTKTIALQLAWFVGQTDLRLGKVVDPTQPDVAIKNEDRPSFTPWYAGRFKDINEVTRYWRENYQKLRQKTKTFSDCFYDTTLPDEVIEAIAANLTILKSPTVLRQADGRLWGYEGCCDSKGCCIGSCTHVWNYAQAIPHLFPALERTLRETEFFVSQDSKGHQAFRTPLPIMTPLHDFHAAADGQLGGVMKVYREWRISGNTDWLSKCWPRVKASLDFCINKWDPNHKGVLEEPHHNTYDIEFWGPNGMCMSFYIGALTAAVAMGKTLDDDVSTYAALLAKATRYMEKQLYNGEYFCQKVKWKGLQAKDPTQRTQGFDFDYSPEARELLEKEGPKYQYGTGCLSDGVLGTWIAAVCGLGQVVDQRKIASHLRAVYKYNLNRDLSGHANPQRSTYACGSEGGLLLCSWPRGGKPSLPFVYSNEVWTGIEYQVAAHLMLMGHVDEGLEIVRICRDRYDGRIRNPFNEYECGHWYARAMASYGMLQGLTGIRYDAVEKTLHIEPRIKGDFRSFFATATGYGTVGVKDGKPFVEVEAGTMDDRHINFSSAS